MNPPALTHRVDDALFPATSVLRDWQATLDERGLRATGSPEHAAYVRDLTERLIVAGATEVHTEAISMQRWTPSDWSLAVSGRPVPVVSPVAYSGATSHPGITAPLSTEPAAGTIGVVEIGLTTLRAGTFDLLDWDAPNQPVHPDDYDPTELYQRVWLSQDQMRVELARFKDAGAAGLVLVVDLPAAEITSGYLLYDGVHRGLPALFVAREQAAELLAAAASGEKATLVLEAEVTPEQTHNVIGLIPGSSDEIVVLHSHTDGPNGLEDNGPEAIIAMTQYLTSLDPDRLPRTILILLSTGHFALEEAWGVEAFLEAHADDIVPRIAAAVTLEHLGALVPPPVGGDRVVREFEFGCVFSTGHRPVIDAMRSALVEAAVTEARVLRPFAADLSGRSPDGSTWPGDGCAFWATAGLPSANFITGPGYLLNVEPVARFIDADAMRRQAIAFTNAVLALAATPWSQLHAAPAANRPVALG